MSVFATSINLSFTLYDILIGLLIIAGIVVLALLAKVLLSVSKTLTTVNKVVEDNKVSLVFLNIGITYLNCIAALMPVHE